MADHFECMLDDWDLDAVIRGCSSNNNNGYLSSATTYYDSCIQQADDMLLNSDFPDYSSVNLDDLEEIYKPFYSLLQYPTSSQHIPAPSASSIRDIKEEPSQKLEKQDSLSGSSSDCLTIASTSAAATRRKRKSLQKRVVQHVTADGLSADKWAWRKYGQKPIKGSRYPRSYYRCSSSKGCPARKQVEQSSSDPSIFTIAYRAEHNHAEPTRRSSLSGITRNKLSSATQKKEPAAMTMTTSPTSTPQSSSSSPVSPANLSPVMSGCTEDEFPRDHHQSRRLEGEEDEFSDMMFQEGDDFFKGLEAFDGMASDLAFDGSFSDHLVTGFPHWIDERSASSYNTMGYM